MKTSFSKMAGHSRQVFAGRIWEQCHFPVSFHLETSRDLQFVIKTHWIFFFITMLCLKTDVFLHVQPIWLTFNPCEAGSSVFFTGTSKCQLNTFAIFSRLKLLSSGELKFIICHGWGQGMRKEKMIFGTFLRSSRQGLIYCTLKSGFVSFLGSTLDVHLFVQNSALS